MSRYLTDEKAGNYIGYILHGWLLSAIVYGSRYYVFCFRIVYRSDQRDENREALSRAVEMEDEICDRNRWVAYIGIRGIAKEMGSESAEMRSGDGNGARSFNFDILDRSFMVRRLVESCSRIYEKILEEETQ